MNLRVLTTARTETRRARCIHEYRKVMVLSLVFVAICLSPPGSARGQSVTAEADTLLSTVTEAVCGDPMASPGVKEALRLVCVRERIQTPRNAIVIGFVGGFVRGDDRKHPEVQFASFLRDRYPSVVHAEVFANHDGKKALRQVLKLLDLNGDGVLTATEKERASIIIYGHSWGASQAITLARELGQLDIPVLLTIQVDSVHKLRHQDSTIPSNVKSAVNFYETNGLVHGRADIRAADPERTNIVGNFRMAYKDRRINCDNYPWLARHFNRPHHEIENDPLVWDFIASLIDSELMKTTSAVEASLPSQSLRLK